MASQNEGYWSRSWALLTRDEGWFKPLLVLAAAHLVPVVGSFGADGYALEWGRLTAWGVDAAPKQRNVDVGGCIKSGARAFVVALGYGLALGLLYWLVDRVFGETLGGLLTMVIGVLAYVLVRTASLHATIYQRIGAGYQVNRIFEMVRRDHKGFLRVVGLSCVAGAVLSIVASLVAGGTIVASIGSMVPRLMELERIQGSVDEWRVMEVVLDGFAGLLPMLFVLGYLVAIGGEFVHLMVTTATALWIRQFDVPNWGDSSDPLPDAPVAPGVALVTSYQAPESQVSANVAPADPMVEVPVADSYAPAEDPSPTAYPIPQPQEVVQPVSDYQAAPIAAPAAEQPMVPASAEEGSDQPVRFGLEQEENAAEPQGETSAGDVWEPADTAAAAPAMTDEQRVETIRESVDALAAHAEDEQTLQDEAARYARERMEAERQALDSLVEPPVPEESTVPTFTLEEALDAEAQEPEQAEDTDEDDASDGDDEPEPKAPATSGERIVDVIDLSGSDAEDDE